MLEECLLSRLAPKQREVKYILQGVRGVNIYSQLPATPAHGSEFPHRSRKHLLQNFQVGPHFSFLHGQCLLTSAGQRTPDYINCKMEVKWTCKMLLKVQAKLAGKDWCYLPSNRKSRWSSVENRHGCLKPSVYILYITILSLILIFHTVQRQTFFFSFLIARQPGCCQLCASCPTWPAMQATQFEFTMQPVPQKNTPVHWGYLHPQATGLIKCREEGEELKLLQNW